MNSIKKLCCFKSVLSVLLAAVMILASAAPVFAADDSEKEVTFATMSGISYVSLENRGNYNDAFLLDAKANNYQYEQLDGLLDSSFAAIKERVENEGLKYLLINGGLTYNGEYSNHAAIAEKLNKLEEDTGVQVITLIGGNDVNNSNSSSFSSGERVNVTPATVSQIKTLYADLGFDVATNKFSSYNQTSANLSYSVELDGGYRLIVIDATYFTYLNGVTNVSGKISDELLEWIKTECTIARYAGQTVIGMCFWDITGDPVLDTDGLLSNADEIANVLADSGMHYIYTAGSNKNDISSVVSDNGNVIYDIMTAGLVSYPNTFRVSTFEDGIGTFGVVDADEVLPVVSRTGKTYTQPYRETASLRIQYADYDLARYFSDLIRNYLSSVLIPGVKSSGTVESFISAYYGISLVDEINELIGGGLNIFDVVVIFDASNIMNMLEDMFQQAQSGFLQDPNTLAEICYEHFAVIFNKKISDVPCSAFVDTYGFGDSSDGGTIGDLLLSCIVYSKCGNEDSTSDKFVSDVLNKLQYGNLVPEIADLLCETLIRDLLFDDILSQIEMKPQYLLFLDDSEDSFGYYLQIAFKAYIALHGESSSVTGAVNSVLKDGLFKDYGYSIDEVIDNFVAYYYSGEDKVNVGTQLADILGSYVNDDDPKMQGDFDVTYNGNNGAISSASRDNYRLPSMITVTPGNDTQTEFYVTWYTKSTVTGTNIEIYSNKNSSFFGKHFVGVEGASVAYETVEVDRTYNILDLGFVSLGENTVNLLRHTLKVSGLQAGCTYFFRVGDSSKGWWSDTATVTTAEDTDSLSFIHVSDSMGNTSSDFEVFDTVLTGALYKELYPDADFILHTGNYVDDADDLRQWQKLLDGSDDKFMNNYIVPVAGSNDSIDTIKNNFAIGSLLGASEKTGVYYSMDYGIAHIVVLDSGDVKEDGTLSDTQLAWLENDMNSVTSEWRILAVHDPVYTNGSSSQSDNYSAYMKQITALADTYDIDLILTGSDGVYYRTDSMRSTGVTDSPTVSLPYYDDSSVYYKTITAPSGTVYSSIGSAGYYAYEDHEINNVSKLFEQSGKSLNPDIPMFTGVEIIGDILYLTTYTIDTGTKKITKIDSLSVIKTEDKTGDVNFDGSVTAADARLILRASAGLESLSVSQLPVADINGDSRVTAADARIVLRMSAGLE